MKKKITSLLLVVVLALSLAMPAWAASSADSAMAGYAAGDVLRQNDLAVIAARLEDRQEPAPGTSNSTLTQQEAVRYLLGYAGLKESQLGTYPDDYNAMAESTGLIAGIEYKPAAACTAGVFRAMLENVSVLYNAMHAAKKAPLFVNGLAQPIFEYSDPTQPNGDSGVIRFCVYVETNYDTDGDGKLDLVKALVQLPHEVLDGMQVATIYEARPYITGCIEGVDTPYGKEGYDLSSMYAQPAARVAKGSSTTAQAAAAADPDDWYYYNDYEQMYDYEDLTWYDYYLVRGFAVVECGGLGTLGSEGFETCGSDLEIDAFKCVIEWLNGRRAAYTDLTSNIKIEADWSNGNVGMTGRSYAGTTQFGLATTGVEGLKTIVPVAGIASWYEYTNSQGIYNSGDPAYTESLAFYCAGRYLDQADYAKIAEKYGNYLNQQRLDQTAANGDYTDHWANRDYTLNASKIKIPALIVHGLNDDNVRTKEFDLMYDAFQTAGQDVKLLLHQGTHLTPTYPSHETEMYIGGELYDTVLNRWFSHYLYGVSNGAEKMAAVTAQSNVDGSWTSYDSWDESSKSLILKASGDASTVINSNLLAVDGIKEVQTKWGTSVEGWQDAFTAASTASSAMYTMDVTQDTTISGAVKVHVRASTDAAKAGISDAVMLSAMLVDVSDTAFPTYTADGSYLPEKVLKEKGAWMGGGVENFDLVEFQQTNAKYKIIARGWMDMCNPKAGYASSTAVKDTSYVPGGTYDYTIYLQPNLYTVKEGHKLALVIYAYEPGMISYDTDYNITISTASTYADIPVRSGDVTGNPFTDVAADKFYYTPVLWAYEKGITSGVTATAFQPNAACTRGQVVTFLWRAMGKPEPKTTDNPFTDVADASYCGKAVLWAYENGITAGVTADTFAPDATVSRDQFVTFLWRSAGKPAAQGTNPFTDVADGSAFYDAILWAYESGVTAGVTADTFSPKDACARGQVVTFLHRYLEK